MEVELSWLPLTVEESKPACEPSSGRLTVQTHQVRAIGKTLGLCICVCLLFLSNEQSRAEPHIYYVAPRGSDSNTGTIFDLPLQSIGAAAAKVKPGDTVLVMPGIYAESFLNIPGGASWQEPVRLAAYDPDDRPILRPASGAARVFSFAAASSSFIEIDGFVMDAANVTTDVVKVTWGSGTGGSHDIRIRNSELKNAPTNGILVTGYDHGVDNNTFTNLDVHHNGTTDFNHGFYISTPLNTVEYSRIHHNAGWGFHNYGGDPSYNQYFQNQVYGNAVKGRGAGAGIYNGENVKATANVFEANRQGVSVQYGASNAEVVRNIVVRNEQAIQVLGADVTGSSISRNLLYNNKNDAILDTATETTITLPSAVTPNAAMHWDTGELVVSAEGITLEPSVDLQGLPLGAVNLLGSDLIGANLTSSGLRNAELSAANLDGARLADAWLVDAHLDSASLAGADFTNATITGAGLEAVGAKGFTLAQLAATASYRNRDLQNTRWCENDLSGWNFASQNLANAMFYRASLAAADFSGANLTNASLGSTRFGSATLTGANLSGAHISGAVFANTTTSGFTKEQLYSTASYNASDLTGVDFSENDLRGWNFLGQDLSRASFHGSLLTTTDFKQAQLYRADLISASLENADLRHANLRAANFASAVLRNAQLQETDMTGANLSDAELVNSNLTDAIVTSTDFSNTTTGGFTKEQLYSTASYKARNLRGMVMSRNDLASWDMSEQDLADTGFTGATLLGTDFTDASIPGAGFENTVARGFTKEQLYSTASYKSGILRFVRLSENDLSGWDFSGQDLTSASFRMAGLAGANLTGSRITRAIFDGTTSGGFTREQLYSTASYEGKALRQVGFSSNDLSGWNFEEQDLSGSSFSNSNLTETNFRQANLADAILKNATLTRAVLDNANVAGADLTSTTPNGFTSSQLYATASYRDRILRGVRLGDNQLSGWDFSHQDLAFASFLRSDLAGANLTSANLVNADLRNSVLRGADLRDAVIRGARLDNTVGDQRLTPQQFYATASYRSKDLQGVSLLKNDLSGWSFRQQNLANASFYFDTNLTSADFAQANLTNADMRGATLTGTILTDSVVNGANFEDRTTHGFAAEQLYSTASYKRQNLRGIGLAQNVLTDWSFAGQDLSEASFDFATVKDVDFTGATIAGASFVSTTSRGFTEEMLRSTTSYQKKELAGVDFSQNDLSGWDLSGQNLMNSSFVDTRLTNTNLTAADLRGATGAVPLGATRNMIWPNGEIRGLRLDAGDSLVVRDSARRIIVQDEFTLLDAGQLEIVISDANWQSTIVVAAAGAGAAVELGGSLKIRFEGDSSRFSLVDTTFDLFDWPQPHDPGNRFAQIDLPVNTDWDLGNLYTTGEVRYRSAFLDTSVGDFDDNLLLDTVDIDLLSEQVRNGTNSPAYDLNGDMLVDQWDRSIWVEHVYGTIAGDADLDRKVAFADFTSLLNSYGATGGWGQGDFDGNGIVTFPDFVLLAVNYGQSRQTFAAVPEPTQLPLTLLGFILSLGLHPRRRQTLFISRLRLGSVRHLLRMSLLLLVWGLANTARTVSGQPLPPQSSPADAAWPVIKDYFVPPADWARDYGKYRSPLLFADGRQVRTPDEWQQRRTEIRAEWESLLGAWPPLLTEPQVELLDSQRRENLVQQQIRFRWTPHDATTGYLLLPDAPGRRPAVVTVFYEPETAIGGGKPHLDFARQLARRGFVTLSIGTTEATAAQTYAIYYPSIDEARVQPLSMLAYAAANAWYVLAVRDDVDRDRIGIVGHSFGGKWAMFASCLFDRYACAAWSDPGIVFDESRGNVNYWEPWYLGYHPPPWRRRGLITPENPARGLYPRLVASGHDLHELHALMAPRPFFVSGGSEDTPQRWQALNHSVEVNRILGFHDRVGMSNRPEHSPDEASNRLIYAFFQHVLMPPEPKGLPTPEAK